MDRQTDKVGLLDGCFGLNGPLRQHFSLYWVVTGKVITKWPPLILSGSG